METIIFNIEPDLLRACQPVMSKEEARYYLKGVHIVERNGSIYYEATNGHVLVQVKSHLPQDGNEFAGLDIIVPDTMVRELSKKKFVTDFGAIGDMFVPAVVEGPRISIEFPDGIFSRKLVDGTYPEIDRAIPSKASMRGHDFEFIGFNLQYLSDLAKSLKAFKGTYSAEFAITDMSGPAMMKTHGERGDWIGVIMPLRT